MTVDSSHAVSWRTRLGGVYAALATPVNGRGRPVPAETARLIDFVLEGGADGVCLGGGTAEYPHFSVADRKAVVAEAARHLDGRAPLLTSIGAPTLRDVLELGAHALEHGSKALLVPMPFFYKYDQQDLEAYLIEVARTLEVPCLVYNLAAFASPLNPETTSRLLRSEPHLVGLKDSSGDRNALMYLQAAREGSEHVLLCGSDALFFDALEAGWDGAISGIASCCPEVLATLHRHYRAGRRDEAARCQTLLDELVSAAGKLPFPWSIRVAAEVRGYPTGPLPYPLSPGRQKEVERLRAFYGRWFEEHVPGLRAEIAAGSNQRM